MMPSLLVLVRHGKSDGNECLERLMQGDGDKNPSEIIGVPGWQWRLTDEGVKQAEAAGSCLRDVGWKFQACITSPTVRAAETAVYIGDIEYRYSFGPLAMPWKVDYRFRERDWGTDDVVPTQDAFDQRLEHIKNCLSGHSYHQPPGGESKMQAMSRTALINDTLARNNSKEHVLAVTHAEIMACLAISYYGWTDLELDDVNQTELGMALLEPVNGQIVAWSRYYDPVKMMDEEFKNMLHVTSIVPWDRAHRNNIPWQRVTPREYQREELKEICNRFPHYH